MSKTETKNTMTHPGYTKTGDGFFIKSSLLPANNCCHRCEETDFSPNCDPLDVDGYMLFPDAIKKEKPDAA
jgi:hypothetical protein